MLERNFNRAEFIAKEISMKAPKFAEVLIAAIGLERDQGFQYDASPDEIGNIDFRNIAMLLVAENNLDTAENLFIMNMKSGSNISVTCQEWIKSKTIFLRLLAATHQLGLISLMRQIVVRRKNQENVLNAALLVDLFITLSLIHI